MQYKAVRKLFVFIFIILTRLSFSWAHAPWPDPFKNSMLQVASWNQFEDSTGGRTPKWLQVVLFSIMGGRSDGAFSGLSEKCYEALFVNDFNHLSPREYQTKMELFLASCESEISLQQKSTFVGSLKSLALKVNFKEHPLIFPIRIQLPNSQILSGWFGWKGDFEKRPLLIIRGGIFSSPSEFLAERMMWMQTYDQSPANVLMLENNSGPVFIKQNNYLAPGGLAEAVQNLFLAKKLQDPQEPLSAIISEVGLMGLSLGGQGVYMAHQMNQLNGTPITQFFAFCPALNLEKTSRQLQEQGIYSLGVDFWMARRLQGLEKYQQQFGSLPWSSLQNWSPLFQKSLWKYVEENYAVDSIIRNMPVQLSPFYLENKKFWAHHKGEDPILNKIDPLMIFITKKDHLVPPEFNSMKLKNLSDNIGVIQFSEGMHCAFPGHYRWDLISSLVTHSFESTKFFSNWKWHLSETQEVQTLNNSSYYYEKNFKIKNMKEISKSELNHVLKNGKKLKFEVSLKDQKTILLRFNYNQHQKYQLAKWRNLEIDMSQIDFSSPRVELDSESRTSLEESIRRWLTQNLTLIQSNSFSEINWVLWRKWVNK